MLVLKAALSALVIAVMSAPAMAQVPKAADGKPDLTGFWTNKSLTPLQRAPTNKTLVVNEEDAKRIAGGYAIGGIKEEGYKGSTYSDPNKGAPPKGGEDFGVQAYDNFWWDSGTMLGKVKGEYRTSNIVEPANGQIPYIDVAGETKKRTDRRKIYETGNDQYDGPEVPTLMERCVVFGVSGGPGMLSSAYNNNYRFVQTPDHMLIVTEMIHEVRVIPIFATPAEARKHHKPAALEPWLGDSVGWWEGDTFVMETTNVKPEQGQMHSFSLSPTGIVTERFTRTSDKDIFYEFSVNDPAYYTQPWKAELSFYPSQGMYEYACHEGNYGMIGILAGAREKERLDAAKTAKAKTKTVKGGQ
ncbi:MAG: hypothetical protein ABL956_05035 [Hyphomonadaceae bacterium]